MSLEVYSFWRCNVYKSGLKKIDLQNVYFNSEVHWVYSPTENNHKLKYELNLMINDEHIYKKEKNYIAAMNCGMVQV